jgi:hypothetical protein
MPSYHTVKNTAPQTSRRAEKLIKYKHNITEDVATRSRDPVGPLRQQKPVDIAQRSGSIRREIQSSPNRDAMPYVQDGQVSPPPVHVRSAVFLGDCWQRVDAASILTGRWIFFSEMLDLGGSL